MPINFKKKKQTLVVSGRAGQQQCVGLSSIDQAAYTRRTPAAPKGSLPNKFAAWQQQASVPMS
jgi:hypothetical protein